MSTTDFACANLAAKAQSVLDRHRRIGPGSEDRDRFLNSFAADEDPNEALMQAARDFSARHTGSGSNASDWSHLIRLV